MAAHPQNYDDDDLPGPHPATNSVSGAKRTFGDMDYDDDDHIFGSKKDDDLPGPHPATNSVSAAKRTFGDMDYNDDDTIFGSKKVNIDDNLFDFLKNFDLNIPKSLEIFCNGELLTKRVLNEFIISFFISERMVDALQCFQYESEMELEIFNGESAAEIKDFIYKYLVAADMGDTAAKVSPHKTFVPTKANLLGEFLMDPLNAIQGFEQRFGKDCFKFEGGCTLKFRIEMQAVLQSIVSASDRETKLRLITTHIRKWKIHEDWNYINLDVKEDALSFHFDIAEGESIDHINDALIDKRGGDLMDDLESCFPWTKVEPSNLDRDVKDGCA